jgi:hypothetical protein
MEKDGVAAFILVVPPWSAPDDLTMHSLGSRELTGCVEDSRCRVVDGHPTMNMWKLREGNIGGRKVGVRIELVVQKASQELGKVRLICFNCQLCNVPSVG